MGRLPASVQIVEEVYRSKPLEARDTLSKLANALTDKNPKEEDISLQEARKMLADISNTVTTVASHAFEQDRAIVNKTSFAESKIRLCMQTWNQ